MNEQNADEKAGLLHLIGIFLYSVGAAQRISKKSEVGGHEREENKQNGEYTKQSDRKLLAFASHRFVVELSGLIDICNGGANKENRNVEPIGRFADRTVIGVENNRDQYKPQKDTAKLDAPKILSVSEEKALYNGK